MNDPLVPFVGGGTEFERLCSTLRSMSGQLDQPDSWPGSQFERLAEAGVLGWVIPRQFGGSEIAPEELTRGYELLSAACLTTTFVLTQRNGACQRIAGCENDVLKDELLPGLCTGETFATVGISHLSTSGQHLRTPAVQVEQSGSGLVLSGIIPWVTGARHADHIVTGGTCADGRQVLAVIATDSPNVVVRQPPNMLALNASQTGAVELNNVLVDKRFLIAGPVEGVMKRGKGGGTGSVTTSALALGTASCALALLRQEAEQRADLREIVESIEAERAEVAEMMYELSQGESTHESPAQIAETVRKRANSIVLRATQAYLAASKGAGFVSGHPAERLVREAMFFLVWSCPQPVLTAALREFACLIET
jgi:alkylation response protein AidB-like acyl-CoA dehydrogenase